MAGTLVVTIVAGTNLAAKYLTFTLHQESRGMPLEGDVKDF
jgi:hypothetical protein